MRATDLSEVISAFNWHKKMIDALISWSLKNRFIVLMIAGGIIAYGIYAVKNTPVDAIPDLSENQVIIFTEWMGRSPQIIED